VLIEETYARATESSPNGNADGGDVPRADVVGPGGGGVTLSDGAVGLPVDILPSAKLILHRSSARKSMLASG
jgi:hypothetical protein